MSDDGHSKTPSEPSFGDDGERENLGSYRLLEKIGEGGMGEVFLAEQVEPIRRRVAIKIVKPGMDSKQVVARFEAERQALALMDHACIARVFDAGTTPRGRPYFVMEHVKGVPITTYCDQHKLETRARLQLMLQVCDAVQHAHQKGIIHRDLKPSNILVTIQSKQPVPKIIDFGVAKALSHDLTRTTMFTELGQLLGTPEYMSPEQADVSGAGIDTRSDVYSLGVILYELLTGELPHDGKQLRSAGYENIRRIIREDEPPRPSTRMSSLDAQRSMTAAKNRASAPARLVGQLRGDLDWITMKALDKDRSRRYQTANAFAMDIQRYLNDEAVLASPPSALYRLRKAARRHRGAVVALASVALILVAATIVSTSLYFRAERESRRARVEARKSEQVAAFLSDMLSGVGPSAARGRDTEMLREILNATERRIGDELRELPWVEADIRRVLSRTQRDLGEYPAAEENLQRALSLLDATAGASHPNTLEARAELGALLYALGRMEQADSLLAATADAQAQLLGREHPQTLATLATLVQVYVYQGRVDEAAALGRSLVTALRRTRGDGDEVTQQAMFSLAQALTDQRDHAAADSVYVALLRILERQRGSDHPQTLSARVSYGWLLRQDKRTEEALRVTRTALSDMRRVLGNDHSETMVGVNNLAIIYKDLGRFEEALPLYIENVESGKRVMGEEHPETVVGMVNLAAFYRARDRCAQAESLATRCVEIFESVMQEDYFGRGIALSIRGMCRADAGRDAAAEKDILAAHELMSPLYPEDHPRIQELAAYLSKIYTRGGDMVRAAEWSARVTAERD